MGNTEIVNAKITSTMLGNEDHGIFTCFLYLEWQGARVGFGGYGLDEWNAERNKRVDMKGTGLEFIKEIMRVVGVEKWEDLKGKFIRVDTEGWGGKALGIGNLIEDKWFYPKQWFEEAVEVRLGGKVTDERKGSKRASPDGQEDI